MPKRPDAARNQAISLFFLLGVPARRNASQETKWPFVFGNWKIGRATKACFLAAVDSKNNLTTATFCKKDILYRKDRFAKMFAVDFSYFGKNTTKHGQKNILKKQTQECEPSLGSILGLSQLGLPLRWGSVFAPPRLLLGHELERAYQQIKAMSCCFLKIGGPSIRSWKPMILQKNRGLQTPFKQFFWNYFFVALLCNDVVSLFSC